MNVVFFGGRNVISVADSLDSSFDLNLIVTTDSSMVRLAITNKIPYTQVLEIDQKLITEIKKLDPDIGVVADFGLIIPEELIDVFPYGILNIHPSLLPKYRGPTPVQSALLNGDSKTGVAIIKIDEQLDHGPVLYQEERTINPGDSTPYLLQQLFQRAADVLPDVINSYVDEEIPLQIQDDEIATYTKQLTKKDGYVDVENPPDIDELNRKINALAFWPGVWTKYTLTSKEVIIKLHPNGIIHVEGKKPMSYKDFKNGYEKGEEFLKKLGLI
jgi:methionyl-tRNA formyltransferase